jgi:micrococcal nuclease
VAIVLLLLLAAGCRTEDGGDAASAPVPAAARGPVPALSRGAGGGRGAVVDAVVRRVVDGDTLVAGIGDHDERVRLIGYDTPETVKPDTPVECFGPEASARLHALLPPGTPLRLERDAEERDVYGRLLAYAYRVGDGLFVNLAMTLDGYGATLTIPPDTAHAGSLAQAQAQARADRRGLWGSCAGPHVAR